MSALALTLEREIDLISRFLVVLEQEQEALQTAQPEALAPLLDSKTNLVDQLNKLESERIKLVGGRAELSDKERMLTWLEANPAEKKIAALWNKLIALALSAKSQSELNSTLVKLHLDRTAKALAILTRHTQENTLYGSNGQASIYTGSRIVDSA
jgi:flagellar biosynthesis protein FlgN